jgi:hypothetical protein
VPSLKTTVPVSFRLNCGVTVTVNVIECPLLDELRDEANVVVLEALLMT